MFDLDRCWRILLFYNIRVGIIGVHNINRRIWRGGRGKETKESNLYQAGEMTLLADMGGYDS
jgi:hypothetical protein